MTPFVSVRRVLVLLSSLAVCLTSPLAAAQEASIGGDLEVYAVSIDGGGGVSAAGDFELLGIVGQPDAGVLSGGAFELVGGFLPAGPAGALIFHDDFETGDLSRWSATVP